MTRDKGILDKSCMMTIGHHNTTRDPKVQPEPSPLFLKFLEIFYSKISFHDEIKP